MHIYALLRFTGSEIPTADGRSDGGRSVDVVPKYSHPGNRHPGRDGKAISGILAICSAD